MSLWSARTAGISGHNPTTQADLSTSTWYAFAGHVKTKDVVKLGDLKIQNTEQSTHVIPQALSAGALVLGVLLIGAVLYQRR